MGQRPKNRGDVAPRLPQRPEAWGLRPPGSASTTWSLFETPFGWTALERCDRGVLRVLIGSRSKQDLTRLLPVGALVSSSNHDLLTGRIQDYFAGTREDFDDVPLAATWSTPFQRAVVRALRQVRYGETTTYGELARRAGRPGAARAVGQVMATNPVPLLVPCHRVLAAGGALGGFSAPTGTALKRRLLQLESALQTSEVPEDFGSLFTRGGRRG